MPRAHRSPDDNGDARDSGSRDPADWDAAFDRAMGARPAAPRGPFDSLGDLAGSGPGVRGGDGLDALGEFDGLGDLDAVDELAGEFAALDARDGGERFAATFRKLTSGSAFSEDELACTLETAAYSLTELGELRVLSRERIDPMAWEVVYAVVHPGPMAAMMAGSAGGVMAAWRGRMPIGSIGLVEAEGRWLG